MFNSGFKLTKYYNWLFFSLVNPEIKKIIEKYAHGKIADIGCGIKPYKELAKFYVTEHVGIDHKETFHDKDNIDIFSDVYEIPVEDESFDFILCTDVLEHLEEPLKAVKEAYRILKKGNYALYTVPFFWHLHEEPRDFYRYTIYGLKYLFEKNNFEVIEIKPLSGFIVMATQELCYYLLRFRRGGVINPLWWIVPPVVVIIQFIAFYLNKVDRSKEFSNEYIVLVKKS